MPSPRATSPAAATEAFLVRIQARAPYAIAEHSHAVVEILYLLEGRYRVTAAGSTKEAGPGDLLVFRPGQPHREQVDAGPVGYVCLRFPEERLAGLRIPATLPPVVRVPWPERFRALAEDIAREQAAPDRWTPLLVQGHLVQFTALLHRALAQAGQRGLRSLVARHLDGPLDLASLADAARISRRTLGRRFRAETGEAPARWQRRERLTEAARRLRTGDASVAAIAEALGFSSSQHLIRRFREAYGMTPGAFRTRG